MYSGGIGFAPDVRLNRLSTFARTTANCVRVEGEFRLAETLGADPAGIKPGGSLV